MARILVLYYSSYGHIAKMADAVGKGVRQAGHDCDIRRVPETAPAEVAAAAGFVADDSHELISGINALADYDGLVDPGETAVTTAPYLLWAAGEDGVFGAGKPSAVGAPVAADVKACDDVTNFRGQ